MRPEEVAPAIERRVREVFVGHAQSVELLLAALAARAHVLIEGPPGTAKTLLAWSLARSVDLGFKRVQMTPDLMPSDLLGTSVWLPHEGRFDFRAGPLFTDVLLADELNRAPPKTQAALLEAMQERQITQDGVSRALSDGFWVVATQNPLEQEGTYPLPESELDRFSLKLTLDYPTSEEERAILEHHRDIGDPMERMRATVQPVIGRAALDAWQRHIATVHVADTVLDYVEAIVRATRHQADLSWGAGPRASVALVRCSRALALVRGRSYVVPDDVRELAEPVLAHRIRLAPEAQIAGQQVSTILERLLGSVPVPAVHAPVAQDEAPVPA
jgi:MoxR-like ATPase